MKKIGLNTIDKATLKRTIFRRRFPEELIEEIIKLRNWISENLK
jgi:hypothetical protein